jgi:hypothetical protein
MIEIVCSSSWRMVARRLITVREDYEARFYAFGLFDMLNVTKSMSKNVSIRYFLYTLPARRRPSSGSRLPILIHLCSGAL